MSVIQNSVNPLWFIMTTPAPESIEERLLDENMKREQTGQTPFRYFIPYRFLQRRVASVNPEDEAGESRFFNPKNRADVAANNELRSALKRYVFIKAPGSELESLLADEREQPYLRSLWFYRDRNKQKVTVSESTMEQFIGACCDKQINFEVWPALENISKNAEVVLNTTQFKGCKAKVLQVHHDKKGVSFTLGLDLFSGMMLFRLPHVRMQDVLFEEKDASPTTREANRYKLIEDMQRRLFTVMNRRISASILDPKTVRKDSATLGLIYTYRYHRFETDALRRKHCALMLLCAVLRRDYNDRRELAVQARREMKGIDAQREGKVAIDLRAFLQAVLYIATGDKGCYAEAMAYFHSHAKPSATHKQLMKFMKYLP